MNKSLQDLLHRAQAWPPAAQAELADAAREIERKHAAPYRLSDGERAAVSVGLAEAQNGEFLTDAEMAAFWARHEP